MKYWQIYDQTLPFIYFNYMHYVLLSDVIVICHRSYFRVFGSFICTLYVRSVDSTSLQGRFHHVENCSLSVMTVIPDHVRVVQIPSGLYTFPWSHLARASVRWRSFSPPLLLQYNSIYFVSTCRVVCIYTRHVNVKTHKNCLISIQSLTL